MTKVKTNDIKKGTRVQLKNGWYGTMADNMRGNTRMVEVEGFFTEIGSVYSHDIARAEVGGEWCAIELTKGQIECQHMVNAFGF